MIAVITVGHLFLGTLMLFVGLAAAIYIPILVQELRSERTRYRDLAQEHEEREARRDQRLWRPVTIPWRDNITGAKKAAKKAAKKTLVKMHLKEGTATCPLCREDAEDAINCTSCGTSVHAECAEELTDGMCPTQGCGMTVVRERNEQHPIH